MELTDRALEIHRSALLVDGHNDLPGKIRRHERSSDGRLDLSQNQEDLHTDIPRLRAGGVGAQFWAAYVPSHVADEGEAARYALEQIDVIHRMAQEYPETFEIAYSADDVVRIHREGKIASLIAVENGQAIENSLALLRMYYRLGVRYMTLTHSDTTDWADSATDDPRHDGLTPFGESVILEMNRLGMLVDISHVSAETMRDVLAVSRAPIIASHSSAYAIAPHDRNVPDDVLRGIATNGGIVMVNFYSGYVHPEGAVIERDLFFVARKLRKQYQDEEQLGKAIDDWQEKHPTPRGSVGTVVDHIDHIVKIAGIDHVGLGSDYDGVSKLPVQLDDVSCFPTITQELLNRGYDKEAIHKILGQNALRVMREAEQVAHGWNE